MNTRHDQTPHGIPHAGVESGRAQARAAASKTPPTRLAARLVPAGALLVIGLALLFAALWQIQPKAPEGLTLQPPKR